MITYDLEMIRELGYCSGIENYSRYFDGREPGSRPFCLLDYFPDDFLLIVDESHVTVPQIRAMYGVLLLHLVRSCNILQGFPYKILVTFSNLSMESLLLPRLLGSRSSMKL